MFQKIVYETVFDGSVCNARKEGMVKVRASQGAKFVDIPTGIYCRRGDFEDGFVSDSHPQHDGLNAMIQTVLMDVQSTEIEAFRRNLDITVQMVYAMYMEKMDASMPLVEFNDHVMKLCNKRKPVTKAKYYDAVKDIDLYQKGVCLEDIDVKWLKKYEQHLLAGGNQDSTVWSKMKILRALFNEAIKRDLLKPNMNPFKLYEIPEIRSRTDVLMFTEIEELELMGFHSSTDRHIRDIFCFAAYTGLRWSDLRNLKSGNLKKTGGVTWLQVKTQKTGAFVQMPLSIIFFGNALRILEKYDSMESLCHYECNASVNRGLREVISKAGIGGGQRISMHTARRSFITNLADFGVPIATIQKLAGHSRITTTSKYLQLSTGMIQKELEKAFSSETTKVIHIEMPSRLVLRRSLTGRKLVINGEFLRCKNCSFFRKRTCRLFHRKKTNEDWCDSFSERLSGERDLFDRAAI